MRSKNKIIPFAAFCAASLLLVPSLPAQGRSKPHEGDVLRVFSGQRVYIITNTDSDAPALADALLEGCAVKERRVLTLDEWNALPQETRWYVTCVYLVDRERLPAAVSYPANCRAEETEEWMEVIRTGRTWGVAYDITLSAPDIANLRHSVAAFRRLKEAPHQGAITETVRSLAVVPVGEGALHVVQSFAQNTAGKSGAELPHLIPVADYDARQGRVRAMDEILFIDRSSATSAQIPSAFAAVSDKLTADSGDIIAWRETKPGGYVRAYVSAPSAETLAATLRKSPDNLLALAMFPTPTVLATARDLRPVRRVAVATVKGTHVTDPTAHRIAGFAATQLRNLNAFEVLERNGLTAIFSEIALDQAGLTASKNRAKVRTLAAADALLIVDLSRCEGGTRYSLANERLTPRSSPPRHPSEPSRLKTDIKWNGKENDANFRAVAESLLGGIVGRKSDETYQSDLREYRRVTLPTYEHEIAEYNRCAANRSIEWRQTITAQSTVKIAGSLRLVDLTDGLVLWEAPITGIDHADNKRETRTLTTIGETSAEPGADDLPDADGDLPDELFAHAAETALGDAVKSLASTALLPNSHSPTVVPFPVSGMGNGVGRVIDVDGDSVLVGLGAEDGVKVGATLEATTAHGTKLHLIVTRVRPRTCDAGFAPNTNSLNRGQIKIGDAVKWGTAAMP